MSLIKLANRCNMCVYADAYKSAYAPHRRQEKRIIVCPYAPPRYEDNIACNNFKIKEKR